jgi:hypothetical protein
MEDISGMEMQRKLVDSINQLAWVAEQFVEAEFADSQEIKEIISNAKAVADKFKNEFIVS